MVCKASLQSSKDDVEKAMMTQQDVRNCLICGKPGHLSKECWKNKKAGEKH